MGISAKLFVWLDGEPSLDGGEGEAEAEEGEYELHGADVCELLLW